MKTNVILEKDGDGYLARVEDHQNLFAFAYTEKDAVMELKNVVEVIMDYHIEQANEERIIRNALAATVERYAIQV